MKNEMGSGARPRLLIYGAGGHGHVVLDAAIASGKYALAGLLDDDSGLHGRTIHDVPVLGGTDILGNAGFEDCLLVLAVGVPAVRRGLSERLRDLGRTYATVVHPSVVLGLGAVFGTGSVLLPMSVVHTDASLGAHVIVNTAASVDHDVRVGDFAHIAPGARIGGFASIGRETLIGIGASVLPGVRIGDGVTVGAGAAVTDDVPDGTVVAGVPAREVDRD